MFNKRNKIKRRTKEKIEKNNLLKTQYIPLPSCAPRQYCIIKNCRTQILAFSFSSFRRYPVA